MIGLQVIGTISGSGKIVLKDTQQAPNDPVPVDLDLEKVLGDMPRKTYTFSRQVGQLEALDLPQGSQPGDALRQVLKLPSVHSKRFLTTKVDRCVTGGLQTHRPLQVVLQQCAPSLQPLKGFLSTQGQLPWTELDQPDVMKPALSIMPFWRVTRYGDELQVWWPSSSVWDPCNCPSLTWPSWHKATSP